MVRIIPMASSLRPSLSSSSFRFSSLCSAPRLSLPYTPSRRVALSHLGSVTDFSSAASISVLMLPLVDWSNYYL
ncbi:hypothetical protein CRG98_003369 [Punica granatum]|uniref:Uncharacterized protein n=1 Tax=Punica granatum TaxID=22663 RepID=A0A2I0L6C8_PUNGR|nr:hypothetical protein CRG98_003369 [Punica granatum]